MLQCIHSEHSYTTKERGLHCLSWLAGVGYKKTVFIILAWKIMYLDARRQRPPVMPQVQPVLKPSQPHQSIKVPSKALVGELISCLPFGPKRFRRGFKYMVATRPTTPPTKWTWIVIENESARRCIYHWQSFISKHNGHSVMLHP